MISDAIPFPQGEGAESIPCDSFAGNGSREHLSRAAIFWIRRACRPPSKGVVSQTSIIFKASSVGTARAPREMALASLWARPSLAPCLALADHAADAAHLVGDDGFAVAAAAQDNGPVALALAYRQGRRIDKIRVIARLGRERPEVLDLVSVLDQVLLDMFLQLIPGVIRP